MEHFPNPAANREFSERLRIDGAGRLLRFNPLSGQHFAVTGAKDYGPNTPYHVACERRPTLPMQARSSRRADRWLLGLVLLLVLALLTKCAPAHSAPQEARSTAARAEHAQPAHGRYDWHEVDTTNE